MIIPLCITELIIILSVLTQGLGYYLTIDAHTEECFFDNVEVGTMMSFMYEVSEGGFLDIDVNVIDPDGEIIYEGYRESSGKFPFVSAKKGKYTYCFSNEMSTMTPKVVLFDMKITDLQKDEDKQKYETSDDKEQAQRDLEVTLRTLEITMRNVQYEQEYMNVRDRNHMNINESTNKCVVIWAFLECFILLTLTVGQVFYLKRFFEVRRVI
ncbi:transmembrane emp24 domain-containing protein 2-like [Adelges cooleyi]|uniref:transmembrane emp24 domain-containing protein 2-like n=1 Tax=Adelges cooleyi TaxID=133065 RepID=UPI00218057FA|nr:transmembrane emp24 domain-containing protein 2-like [Adelges cooleyi]